MKIHYLTPDQKEQEIWFNTLISASPYTILYFYPKDNTPGCSLEARDFSALLPEFSKFSIQVFGVSRDSLHAHCSFMQKQGLNIGLISDPDLQLHKQFWARWEKKNYGKIFEWTIRSTFLLNENWEIVKERRNVKATGHVARLVKEIEELMTAVA